MRNGMMEQWSVAAGDSPRGLVESAARAAMKGRERQVNEALRTLDEDHRLGRIARDEYRHRRRALLESLGDEIAQAERETVRRAVPAYDMSTPGELGKARNGKAERKLNTSGTAFDAAWLIERAALLCAIALCSGVLLCYWLTCT
jgi:hypothetical protein